MECHVSFSVLSDEAAFEEYSFKIWDERHYLKANYYWFSDLDQVTFVYCLRVTGEGRRKLLKYIESSLVSI